MPPRLAHPHSTIKPSKKALAQARAELSDRTYKAGELLLKLRPDVPLCDELGLDVIETYNFGPSPSTATEWMRVKLPEGVDVASGLAALRGNGSVEQVEVNSTFKLDAPELVSGPAPRSGNPAPRSGGPDDLDFRMWAMDNNGRRNGVAGADISALDAWNISVGSKNGPLIAVIDTGIDYKHPDLAANMWINPGEIPGDGIDNDGNGVVDDVHGYNAFADNGDPMDDHSHGTHCAGTIGAVGNNSRGVVGVNWDANLMAIKIFDERGNTSLDAILRGLQYASKMGVDITNNSWGDHQPSQALKDAFAAMPEAVHFAAAGNNRNNNDHRNYYPVGHDLPNMVGVAASDRRDNLPTFSNYGLKSVELAAPGAEILSTVAGGGYMIYSGTSMAAPHAAGVAGLILSEFAKADPEEVRDRLLYNSDPVPALSRASQSGGRINAAKSLEIDTVPPAAPNDFKVVQADSKEIRLHWTTTGDDGWKDGPPSDVEVWVSEQPITADNLKQAQRLETERPRETGELATLSLPTGHSFEERNFYFAMGTVDNVGQRSELSYAQATVSPAREVYSNSFGAEDGFTGEDKWARVPREDNSQDWAWTDSPDGKYRNGSDSSLLSPPISLEGFKNCQLSLDARHDIWKKDRAAVEVSSDGENWTSVGAYHGKQNSWKTRNFDLSEFDGREIQVRVRLDADVRHNRDGIYVDNFRIIGDRA